MLRNKHRATIREVARNAGISVATVSRVFNKSPLVHETTAEHVLRIAGEMNYVPNASARSLSIKKTETIALLLPDMYSEFYSEIIRGADSIARNAHYHLIVSSSHSNREELDTTIKMLSGRVDGMIIMSTHIEDNPLLTDLARLLPVVGLSSLIDSGQVDTIVIDNYGGAYQVVRHLIKKGHRKTAIIRGERGNRDAEERLRGYFAALAEANIPKKESVVLDGDFTEESGYKAVKELLQSQKQVSAIFGSNDSMAIGAMLALREQNINIPEQVAVAGFDDIIITRYMQPSLTTVQFDISKFGATAVTLLLKRLTEGIGFVRPKRIVFPTRVVVRESTA